MTLESLLHLDFLLFYLDVQLLLKANLKMFPCFRVLSAKLLLEMLRQRFFSGFFLALKGSFNCFLDLLEFLCERMA